MTGFLPVACGLDLLGGGTWLLPGFGCLPALLGHRLEPADVQ